MSIYKYKPKPMTKTEFEALDILLTYNEVDEKAHWESVGKPPAGHTACPSCLITSVSVW